MKTKLATEREWWCANDLPITQGSRTCLDFTKWTRAMCKPDTRSYSPHLANYLERFLLLLLLACGDTYVLCVVEWAHTHSSTKPQDKTVKFLGQMIRNQDILNTNFIWWSSCLKEYKRRSSLWKKQQFDDLMILQFRIFIVI